MSQDITQFLFKPEGSKVTHKVRTVLLAGVPWFVLADVCAVLEIANVGNASARLEDDEMGSIRNPDVTSKGGNPNVTIINESGLYSLVLNSRKPEARAFKRWLTGTVIPSLRKHGGYIVGQETKTREQLMADAVLLANSVYEEERAKRLAAEAEVSQQALVIAEQAPKVVVYDEHVADSGLTKVHLYAGTLDGVNMLAVKRDLERLPRG